jgi:hypothetical protein
MQFHDPCPIPNVLPGLRAGSKVSTYDGGRFARECGALACLVEYGSINHIVPSTLSTYNSALKKYELFCYLFAFEPWPVDELKLASFIHFACLNISTASISVYLAGVRYGHENVGCGPWLLCDNELVRRTKRFVKRRYPSTRAKKKLPISIKILKVILPLLAGWPRFDIMAIEDLVFATGSVVAVMAFLRGGEAFANSKGTRAVLTRGMLLLRRVAVEQGPVKAVVVMVPQPKMTPHLVAVPVTVFQDRNAGALDPVMLVEVMLLRFPTTYCDQPAFGFADGKPMTQKYMVERTSALIKKARIPLVDSAGMAVKLCAASWRAGGVRSAMDAGVNEYTIMACGRWTSEAWRSYAATTSVDLWRAAKMMVQCSGAVTKALLVGDLVASKLDELADECEVNTANATLRNHLSGVKYEFKMRHHVRK